MVLLCTVVSTSVVVGINNHRDFDDATLKEILEDPELSELLDDPDKLLKMLKRKLRGPSINSDDKCYIATNKADTIIKTKESQDLGAVFIAVPTVTGRQDCIDACCNSTGCNTAIVKEKDGEAGCYLFDCKDPNVCVFNEHSGFSSIQFYARHLAVSDSENSVTKSSSTTSHSATTRTIAPASAGQLYSRCAMDRDCIGGHRVQCNNDHICLCRHGFHECDGICRQDCSRYEFECVNKDNPELSECIAVYYHCDGIAQCRDGSDELNCNHSSISQHLPVPVSVTSNAVTASSTRASNSNSSNHTPQASQPPVTHSTSMSAERHSQTEFSVDTDLVVSSHPVHHDAMPIAKGAVIALTLGIAIVTLLLVFVGCHLRRIRKTSWKGRLRRPVDEDYLINGMYL
jgi:hypothetical protein